MRITIADSGLGGLEVAAHLYERLRRSGLGGEVTFVNLRPRPGRRFEDAIPHEAKIAELDRALALAERSIPMDLLGMASNSLSLLFRRTAFHTRHRDRVVLLDTIWRHQFRRLSGEPGALIFGTGLTLQSGAYRGALVESGVDGAGIVEQSCPGLANAIQDGHDDPATLGLLDRYVGEAAARAPVALREGPAVILACTHYTYIRAGFVGALARHGVLRPRLLCANRPMACTLESRVQMASSRPDAAAPSLAICSRYPIPPAERARFGALVAPLSRGALAALDRVRVLEPDGG